MKTTKMMLGETIRYTVEEILKDEVFVDCECSDLVEIYFGFENTYPIETVEGDTAQKLNRTNKLLKKCKVFCVEYSEDKTKMFLSEEENIRTEEELYNIVASIAYDLASENVGEYVANEIILDNVNNNLLDDDDAFIDINTKIAMTLNNEDEECDHYDTVNECIEESKFEFFKHHTKNVSEVIHRFGFEEFDFDVMKAIEQASFEYYRGILDEHIEDLKKAVALKFLSDNKGWYIPRSQWEEMNKLFSFCETVGDVVSVTDEGAMGIKIRNERAKKIGQIETFYTGGGIWVTCMYRDEEHYYSVSHDCECLTLFDDAIRNCEYGEYPFFDIEWEKTVEEMTEEEKLIFYKMKVDLVENSKF